MHQKTHDTVGEAHLEIFVSASWHLAVLGQTRQICIGCSRRRPGQTVAKLVMMASIKILKEIAPLAMGYGLGLTASKSPDRKQESAGDHQPNGNHHGHERCHPSGKTRFGNLK